MTFENRDGTLMPQSCRVALAAYLHDLGKFAERAGALRRRLAITVDRPRYCDERIFAAKRGQQ
jgi:hypothetical protein